MADKVRVRWTMADGNESLTILFTGEAGQDVGAVDLHGSPSMAARFRSQTIPQGQWDIGWMLGTFPATAERIGWTCKPEVLEGSVRFAFGDVA